MKEKRIEMTFLKFKKIIHNLLTDESYYSRLIAKWTPKYAKT